MLQHTNHVEKKTVKGVKRRVKDAHLHFEYYLDVLKNFNTYLCRQNLINSTIHTVRTVHMCKVGLAAYDTNRWLCTWSPEYIAVDPSLCIPHLYTSLSH